jgi:hypothetical protein
MNNAKRTSLLRKGISATFLGISLLMAVLAIRSYWWRDSLVAGLPNENSVTIQSSAGQMFVGVFPESRVWHVDSQLRPGRPEKNAITSEGELPHTRDAVVRLGTIVMLPHWYLALVLGTCAAVPWIRWRFGLRTLAAGIAAAALALASVLMY